MHRTLGFAKYLNAYGWEVTVLTAHPRAYPHVSEQNAAFAPPHVKVVRAFALDAQRHLSIKGRYPSVLATPDRWQSWIVGGYLEGLRVVRHWRPDAMMSTYPIASAHVIGAALQRRFGLPWVADLRDPMAQESYPPDPRIRRAYARIERMIVERAASITVTTAGTAELYRSRYPDYPARSILVIPNGFDEAAFSALDTQTANATQRNGRKLRFLHSGMLYAHERNPSDLFAAILELKSAGLLCAHDVEFAFRGGGLQEYRETIDRMGLNDLVKLLPPVPYSDALREMIEADACMLLQASNCNQQIPAKVYEYLYARKPIFALTDPAGDTGRLLAELGVTPVTPLDDKEQIKQVLPGYIDALRSGAVAVPTADKVRTYSRRHLTGELAELLGQVISQSPEGARAHSPGA